MPSAASAVPTPTWAQTSAPHPTRGPRPRRAAPRRTTATPAPHPHTRPHPHAAHPPARTRTPAPARSPARPAPALARARPPSALAALLLPFALARRLLSLGRGLLRRSLGLRFWLGRCFGLGFAHGLLSGWLAERFGPGVSALLAALSCSVQVEQPGNRVLLELGLVALILGAVLETRGSRRSVWRGCRTACPRGSGARAA